MLSPSPAGEHPAARTDVKRVFLNAQGLRGHEQESGAEHRCNTASVPD